MVNNKTAKEVLNISVRWYNVTDVAKYKQTSLFSARESWLLLVIIGAKRGPDHR